MNKEFEDFDFAEIGDACVWKPSSQSKNAFVTTAIGGTYFEDFVAFTLPYWLLYARRRDITVVVIRGDADLKLHPGGPSGAWLKLLAPSYVGAILPDIERYALVDTDLIVNPVAPNLFAQVPRGEVGVVSQTRGLPFDLIHAKKRMAFLRKTHYSSDYPLDSFLFATPPELFEAEGFEPREDSFCSGLVVLDRCHASTFSGWYEEVDSQLVESSNAWEQTFLNDKVLSFGCRWIPYDFQAIWNLEMAAYHPSLYALPDLGANRHSQISVANTLVNRNFLHFAGSWPESRAWRNDPFLVLELIAGLTSKEFEEYAKRNPIATSHGKIPFPGKLSPQVPLKSG